MTTTPHPNQHHLILGGARSGKSRFAEKLVLDLAVKQNSSSAYYLATAEALDDEMRKRIERHQTDRKQTQAKSNFQWQLLEEPLELGAVLKKLTKRDIVLIECLTLWLNNCLHHGCWPEQKQSFLRSLAETNTTIMIVSNEVGLGIMPTNQLTRQFIDEAGWLHQELAEHCANVSLITAGLAQQLK